MARTNESLAEISQLVDKVNTGDRPYLGTIDDGVRLIRRKLPYQQRCVYDPEQRHVSSWTEQPVVGLELDEGGIIPLPYGKDVDKLHQPLKSKVVSYFRNLVERGNV